MARQYYDRGLSLSRELAVSDPENTDFQRELGVALYRAGVLARVTGDSKAEALFKECLTIREALAKDQKNERRQVDLILVLARAGEHARAAALAEKFRGATIATRRCCLNSLGVTPGARPRATRPYAAAYEQKSVKAVTDAVASGYRDRVALETEPDLAPIRGDGGIPGRRRRSQVAEKAQL